MPLSSSAVEIVCDRSGSAGSFSYVRPADLEVSIGDAVRVTLGGREVDGIVIGEGNEALATVPIQRVWGQRATGEDLALIRSVAQTTMCDVAELANRLMPREGKTAEAAHAGVVVEPSVENPLPDTKFPDRTLLLRNPTIPPHIVAAWAAYDLHSQTGEQVLVLCPTVKLLRDVLRILPGGAMDLRDAGGWAGFQSGSVAIGVSTRTSALWSCPGLGGIVVVEEDHGGHAEQKFPYTHSRDLSQARATFMGVQLRLITAAPTAHAMAGGSKVVTVGDAANWPNVVSLPVRGGSHWVARVPEDAVIVPWSRDGQWRCVRCNRVPEHAPQKIGWLAGDARPIAPCHRCRGMKLKYNRWGRERCTAVFGEDRVQQISKVDKGSTVVLAGWLSAECSRNSQPGHMALQLLTQACLQVGPEGTVYVPVLDDPSALTLALLQRDLVGNAKIRWTEAVENSLVPFATEYEIWGRGGVPTRPTFPGIRVHGPTHTGPTWRFHLRTTRGTDMTAVKEWVQAHRGSRIRFKD